MNTELYGLQNRLQGLEQANAVTRSENAQIRVQNAQVREQYDQIRAQFETSMRHHSQEIRRSRIQIGLALFALIGAIFLSPANRQAIAQGYGVTLASLNTRLLAVENKTKFVCIGGDGDMHVIGTNLHIENGLGATNGNPGNPLSDFAADSQVNGKGNVIVGYNEMRAPVDPDVRTGSHNLIVGLQQNYSSIGGINVGHSNTISAPYASVSGGRGNTASGVYSSVSGGISNQAVGVASSVSGGATNEAIGAASSVSGGNFNRTFDIFCSVSGGFGNTARGLASSVSGGESLNQTNRGGWTGGAFHSP